MIINIAADSPRTTQQLNRMAEAEIASKFPSGKREILNRYATETALGMGSMAPEVQSEIQAFSQLAYQVRGELEQAIIDNQRIIAAEAYKAATQRLNRYRLADGRPEQIFVAATYDDEGNELVPELPFIPGVDPLPLQVEQIDYTDPENPVVVMVDNPAIVRDDAERAAAQAIIDAAITNPEILADVEARANAT